MYFDRLFAFDLYYYRSGRPGVFAVLMGRRLTTAKCAGDLSINDDDADARESVNVRKSTCYLCVWDTVVRAGTVSKGLITMRYAGRSRK